MPQGSDYIFFLQDKNFNFWRIGVDGNVAITADPYILRFSPDGWNDISVKNLRNKLYKGIDRSVTIPLAYVVDGAKILKHIVYSFGIDEPVYLVIAEQRVNYTAGVSYGFWYKQIYRGEIDWATYNHEGARVTCTALEDGLPKYLKANDKTVYELDMDVPEAVWIKMDGIRLHEKLNYVNLGELDIPMGVGNGQMLPCALISNEGDSTGVITDSEQFAVVNLSSTAFNDGQTNNLVRNFSNSAITFDFTGVIEIFCTSRIASSASLTFRIGVGNNGATVSNTAISTTFGPVQGQTYTIPFTASITLNTNEYLFLFAFSTIIGTECVYRFTGNSKFRVDFITLHPTTYIRALRPQYVFDRLIEKVTESTYTAAISAYLALHADKVLTCGNAIRGLDDAKMKISLEMFFKYLDSIDALGLIDNRTTVGIERENDLYDFTDIIELDAPAYQTMKVSIIKEDLFNELQIGFPEIRNDVGVLNGNQEFNTKFLFSSNATVTTGRLEKISPIKASCYDIEKIRVTTLDKNTTDFKSDNDIYTIHIEDTQVAASGDIPAHYELDRVLNPFITQGLIESDTVFNLWFSPKRSMLRMGDHLHGRFYKSDTKKLYFRSADKNGTLICDGIIEKADVNIGSLDAAIGVPVWFDFEVPPPEELLSLLDLNPLQIFQFEFQGNTYQGILDEISVASSSKKTQQIRLRSVAANDLTKLINYAG